MRRLAQRAPDMKAQIDQAEATARAEADRLNGEIARLNGEIARLRAENSDLRNRLNAAGGSRQQSVEQQRRITQLEAQVQELQRRNTGRDQGIAERDATIRRLAAERDERDRVISDLRRTIDERDRLSSGLRRTIEERDRLIADLRRTIDQLKGQTTERDRTIARYQAGEAESNRTINELRGGLGARDSAITQGQSAVRERDAVIAEQKQTIVQLESTMAQHRGAVASQLTRIQALEASVLDDRSTIATLKQQLEEVRSASLPWWVTGAALAGGVLAGFGGTRLLRPSGAKAPQEATPGQPPKLVSVKGTFRGTSAAPTLSADPSAPVLRIRTSLHPAAAPTWISEGAAS
jgi:chromosome segregation ATPase